MLRAVVVRILWSIPLLFLLSALTFFLAWLTPGNAARVILSTNTDPGAYQRLRNQLGLDKPVYVQYFDWLTNAVHGNLGQSIFSGQTVSSILNSRLMASLSLLVGAALVIAAASVAIGCVSALRGGLLGKAIDSASIVGMSLPTPWIGLLLITAFAVKLAIFPATGYIPLQQDPQQWFTSLVLPVACLALPGIAIVSGQVRGAIIDVLGNHYIASLRASGLSPASILFRHVGKNAAVPVVNVFGVVLIGLLGGTIVVEQLFAIPGLGQLAVSATSQHDLPVLEGVVLYFTVFVIVINLVVDLVTRWLSPRTVQS